MRASCHVTVRTSYTCDVDDLEQLRADAARALAADPRDRDALRTAAAAGAAQWSVARAGARELAVPIGDRLMRVTGHPIALSARRWLGDFWLALLADDPHALAALCYARPGAGPAYLEQLAEAMRRYWLHDPTASAALLAALRATAPEQLPPDEVDDALDVAVPIIEVAFALFDADADKLAAAVAKARPSTGIAALGAHAWRIGIAPEPPLALRYGDRELLLCPYCLAPIRGGMRVCPACLDDPTNDAAIETDLADFHAMPRKRCASCSTVIAKLAVRCPACRAGV
jgi:hypothetical protein